MRILVSMSLFVFMMNIGYAQENQDEEAVRRVVLDLFDAMRDKDTARLGACFAPSARLMTAALGKDGEPAIRQTPIPRFMEGVAAAGDRLIDERLTSCEIRIDGNLASVWADYLLYIDGNLMHCGVDAIQLARLGGKWKITQIMDTRRRDDCVERPQDHVNALLNKWHHAAAIADEDAFFGSMTEDAVYIGTDASERWTRDELRAWSAAYFDRDVAWAFKPVSRTCTLSGDGRTAWFDELLDTWMGDCRGSGVLVKTNQGWKIKHYHLSIAVPNEVVDDYLKLLGEGKE